MKKKWLCVVFAMLALLGASTGVAAELHAGAAAVNIAADDNMVIGGGIGPGKATGQEGELRAVATVVSQGDGATVAIVACDVLFVERDFIDRALARIEKQTGIPASHVLVNATHTHHAPTTSTVHGYEREVEFVRRLEDAIVLAVEAAAANARDSDKVQALYKLGEESTVGANSRVLLSDNTIFWIGPMDDAVRHTGPFDPQLPVLAFRNGADDKLRAVLFNHSTHTIGTRQPGVRSPSFYGLAAQELEEQLGCTVEFLEGASGSTHNIQPVPVDEAIKRMKAAVLLALQEAEPQEVKRVTSLKRPFEFKVRTFDESIEDEKVSSYCRKRAPAHADPIIEVFRNMRLKLKPEQGKTRETFLQAIAIGDVAIVGVPAEYFTIFGVDIKRRSPFKHTMVVELANDWIGYLPNREAHQMGGYQTWMGLHSYAEEGTGERVTDEVVHMLNELAGK
jgi:hypothetical protein